MQGYITKYPIPPGIKWRLQVIFIGGAEVNLGEPSFKSWQKVGNKNIERGKLKGAWIIFGGGRLKPPPLELPL